MEMKGIYTLIIELNKAQEIMVGKKGNIHFQSGFYGYAGSALSSLEHRLKRHLNHQKKLHWHIDFLLDQAMVRNIVYAETVEKKECELARELSLTLPVVNGFGSSDCKCSSHLFFCRDRMALEELANSAFCNLGLTPKNLAPNFKKCR